MINKYGKNNNKIISGIVLYNPDIFQLRINLEAVLREGLKVICIDNDSNNIADIEELVREYDSVLLIENSNNEGIAFALNQLITYSKQYGYSWMLTLDQDSTIIKGIVSNYFQYIGLKNLGMLCCVVRDRKSGMVYEKNQSETLMEVEKCITSGCLCNVEACVGAGGFDETMFIDYVDFDMCLRLRKLGFHIFKANFYGLIHEVGCAKRIKLFGRDLKIHGNPIDVYNENPIRVYYFFRNVVYFLRKHGRGARGYTSPLHIIWRAFLVVVYETPKIKKIQNILKGILDGFKMDIK